ncbi:MAG: hypothetical protein HY704_12785 [Gemmatimonadetes bacterium]|nr:hypothetical protein [Gemmatimonadota bacterium]
MPEKQNEDERTDQVPEWEPVGSKLENLAVGPELDGLPPPFFPPRARRSRAAGTAVRVARPAAPPAPGEQAEEAAIPEDAFFLPDEPIRRASRAEDERTEEEQEEVHVGRFGDESHFKERARAAKATTPQPLAPPSWTSLDADSARKFAERLEALAESLRVMGGTALEIPPAAEPFDLALRAFIAGYVTAHAVTSR